MKTKTSESRLLARIAAVLVVWLAIATLLVSQRGSQAHGTRDAMEAAPELGVLINTRMQVLTVDRGSPAERAGIQAGDVITRLGNTPLSRTMRILPPAANLPAQVPSTISTTADIRALFYTLVPHWEHTVTVGLERQGKPMSVPVFVTAQPYNYDPAHPFPTVTPVPESMDGSVFYL